jgi:hypothetical protein
VRQRLRWEYYQLLKADYTNKINNVPASIFFPKGEPAQMPDIYDSFSQHKTTKALWLPGALSDQPYLLMMEWDACRSGESDFENTDVAEFQSYANPPKASQDGSLQNQYRPG